MTEHKFPAPEPIDWDALEEGDTVWMKAIVTRTFTDHPRKFVSQAYVYLDFHDPGEEDQAVHATTIRLGHVIKAPKPIAVGDKVRADGYVRVYEVLAIDGDLVWLRRTDNSDCDSPHYATMELADLVRVEP